MKILVIANDLFPALQKAITELCGDDYHVESFTTVEDLMATVKRLNPKVVIVDANNMTFSEAEKIFTAFEEHFGLYPRTLVVTGPTFEGNPRSLWVDNVIDREDDAQQIVGIVSELD